MIVDSDAPICFDSWIPDRLDFVDLALSVPNAFMHDERDSPDEKTHTKI